MKLQTLVSTMGKDNYELIEIMNIKSDAIVINQCGFNSLEVIEKNDHKMIWINSNEIGLSKSRNLAIENACEEICVLADDDLVFVDNAYELIIEQFTKNPEIDIIAFQVEGIDKEFKRYHKSQRNLNYLTSMKVASVEIAFRLNSIKNKSIRFNEKFGAGSKHKMGEENIFLFECLKKGLKMLYVPVKIANLYVGDSSWFNGYTENYFYDLGAAYAAMSEKYSLFLILQFAVRKYNLYKKSCTFYRAVKAMLAGKNDHLLDNKNN